MRIIAGLFKSRKIHSPVIKRLKGRGSIRPTSDRARETVFDILNNRFDFTGFSCVDLFAGTGGYGFESISRGASFVNFVDSSPLAVDLIKKTSGELGVNDNTMITKLDAIKFLKENSMEFDAYFADPPYSYESLSELLTCAFKNNFKFFVLETGKLFEMNYDAKRFDCIDRKVGEAFFKIFITNQE